MNKITRAAQAISDNTRLRIINLLVERECCVCEVMQALNISQTRASRNLKILSDAGFLNLRIEGSYSLYSLKMKDAFYKGLLETLKNELIKDTAMKKDAARLRNTQRVVPGIIPKE